MKPFKASIFLLLPVLVFCSLSVNNNSDLGKRLIGKWEYQYSWVDNTKKELELSNIIPVYRIVYRQCEDSRDLKGMPKSVVNMRKASVLKNICADHYNQQNVQIETYYPVVPHQGADSEGPIEILDYGHTYKTEYFIDSLSAGKLVIHDNRVYPFEGHEYYAVKHVYLKKDK